MKPPVISILIVIDFDDGHGSGWQDLRAVLDALSRQQGIEQAEILVADTESRKLLAPPDLPTFRWVTIPEGNAYELKNAGVDAASSEFVAILDADCLPAPGWLASALETLSSDSNIAAVSGHTRYPGQSLTHRALALLDRSYVEDVVDGETPHISNNNAAFRRSAFLEHPLPTNAGIFASNLQSEPMRRSGYRLQFDPRMRVTHGFDGWKTEAEIRVNLGYGVAVSRLLDPSTRHGWLYRFGALSIPLAVTARSLNSCRLATRHAHSFGVRWFELPVALASAFVACAMEAPGMWAALRGRSVEGTAYQPADT